jgi:hypothetical protein
VGAVLALAGAGIAVLAIRSERRDVAAAEADVAVWQRSMTPVTTR